VEPGRNVVVDALERLDAVVVAGALVRGGPLADGGLVDYASSSGRWLVIVTRPDSLV